MHTYIVHVEVVAGNQTLFQDIPFKHVCLECAVNAVRKLFRNVFTDCLVFICSGSEVK